MKAEHLAILTLVLLAGWSFARIQRNFPHRTSTSITVSNGQDREEIKYNGYFHFNDQETAIDSMSPHAWLEFSNGQGEMKLTSDAHGGVTAAFSDSDTKNRQLLMSTAVSEMIAFGYDTDGRIRRLTAKGGQTALLDAMDECRSDDIKKRYLKKILQSDSLSSFSEPQLIRLIDKVAQLGSETEKGHFLVDLADRLRTLQGLRPQS